MTDKSTSCPELFCSAQQEHPQSKLLSSAQLLPLVKTKPHTSTLQTDFGVTGSPLFILHSHTATLDKPPLCFSLIGVLRVGYAYLLERPGW